MKKILLANLFASGILFNLCFADVCGYEPGRDIQDKYCWHLDDFAKKDGETSHHIHQQAPRRNGFQNQEPPITSKSQTFGDTTYHTYDPIPSREGFSR